jgi:cobalt/nickel transport protein
VRRPASVKSFIAVGFLVALLLAFLVAPHASSSPDGLEKIALDTGLDSDVREASGTRNDRLSTGVAGVIGVTITFGAAFGVSKLAKKSRSGASAENSAA